MSFKLKIIQHLLRIKIQRLRYKGNWAKLHAKKWRKKQQELLKSPYYATLAKANTPLNEYPIMNKDSFMSNFDTINTVGIQLKDAFQVAQDAENSRDFSSTINDITVGLSSGTSGNRGVFLASEDERAQWVAAVLDRVLGFSLKKRSVAFFLRANSNLYDSVKSKVLKFEFFDLLLHVDLHIDRLNELNPTFLVAQPSMLLQLAKALENDALQIKPKKIISVAEVLLPEDQAYLEKVFKQKVHQVYQCTEGFLASTCDEGTLHFHEDFFIIEKKYIDEGKTRFHPIITDLERKTQPVIRYELNDIIHEKKNCACGSDWLAIEAIEGRSDDILRFKNNQNKDISIFPDFFRRAIILSSDEIREYALIQKSISEIELYINGSDEAYTKASEALHNLLSKHEIEGVEINRIQSTKTAKGAKLRRIKNES
jgi:putative adenylate-forming enzyme